MGLFDRYSVKLGRPHAEAASLVNFKIFWLQSCKLTFSKFLKHILVQSTINLLALIFQKQFLTFKAILKHILTKIKTSLEN